MTVQELCEGGRQARTSILEARQHILERSYADQLHGMQSTNISTRGVCALDLRKQRLVQTHRKKGHLV